MRTLIIAEIGSSWDNSLEDAYKLIETAKECEADAAKFQWTSDAREMAKRRKASASEAMYTRYLQYSIDDLLKLKDHCDKTGIEFMASVFIPADIPTVAPLVPRFKISAFESKDDDFVRQHVQYDKDIIISVNPTFVPLPRHQRIKQIKILHCISNYPTESKDLNLLKIVEHDLDGFSNHCPDIRVGAWAVAAGASTIEAHVRLNTTPPKNPDYPHSFAPHSFKIFVDEIRAVEAAL